MLCCVLAGGKIVGFGEGDNRKLGVLWLWKEDLGRGRRRRWSGKGVGWVAVRGGSTWGRDDERRVGGIVGVERQAVDTSTAENERRKVS